MPRVVVLLREIKKGSGPCVYLTWIYFYQQRGPIFKSPLKKRTQHEVMLPPSCCIWNGVPRLISSVGFTPNTPVFHKALLFVFSGILKTRLLNSYFNRSLFNDIFINILRFTIYWVCVWPEWAVLMYSNVILFLIYRIKQNWWAGSIALLYDWYQQYKY